VLLRTATGNSVPLWDKPFQQLFVRHPIQNRELSQLLGFDILRLALLEPPENLSGERREPFSLRDVFSLPLSPPFRLAKTCKKVADLGMKDRTRAHGRPNGTNRLAHNVSIGSIKLLTLGATVLTIGSR